MKMRTMLRFTLPSALFALVLTTLMIPTAAIVAPLYIMISRLPGWTHSGVNTFPGMILPMVCSPLGVFMMRQFISTLPEALVEAARLDGASEASLKKMFALLNISSLRMTILLQTALFFVLGANAYWLPTLLTLHA